MSTIVIERRHIPEQRVDGKRLGRHVNHDSRSKNFRVERKVASPVSKKWTRETPILDQDLPKPLGSCTGNASDGVLGTDPFYSLMVAAYPKTILNEATAIDIYGLATQLDGYKGTYPPTDTGSDGLSAAKAVMQLFPNVIKGYTHALTLDDLIQGMQEAPCIVGTDWLTGMDSPDGNGLVHATGTVRGGHEYECWDLDIENSMLGFKQSWGDWGVNGNFYYSFADFTKLLADDGDATFFVAGTAPTPTPPAPTPTPTPGTPTQRNFSAANFAALEDWANSPHVFHKATVASKAWKATTS